MPLFVPPDESFTGVIGRAGLDQGRGVLSRVTSASMLCQPSKHSSNNKRVVSMQLSWTCPHVLSHTLRLHGSTTHGHGLYSMCRALAAEAAIQLKRPVLPTGFELACMISTARLPSSAMARSRRSTVRSWRCPCARRPRHVRRSVRRPAAQATRRALARPGYSPSPSPMQPSDARLPGDWSRRGQALRTAVPLDWVLCHRHPCAA